MMMILNTRDNLDTKRITHGDYRPLYEWKGALDLSIIVVPQGKIHIYLLTLSWNPFPGSLSYRCCCITVESRIHINFWSLIRPVKPVSSEKKTTDRVHAPTIWIKFTHFFTSQKGWFRCKSHTILLVLLYSNKLSVLYVFWMCQNADPRSQKN
jgi:hypothetical protein